MNIYFLVGTHFLDHTHWYLDLAKTVGINNLTLTQHFKLHMEAAVLLLLLSRFSRVRLCATP